MKYNRCIIWLLALMLVAPLVVSCSDDDDNGKVNEYLNWESRNNHYFDSIRVLALKEINLAKKQYGDSWEEHCEWRAFRSFSLDQSSTTNTAKDSIFVKILNTGTGSGSPLSTDSVRVFYAGFLIPTVSYPEGMIFDHSGQSSFLENIFDHETSMPSSFLVTSSVRGFATALQYMHIGDKWRVYIPANLAYKNIGQDRVPAYSTINFIVELVQYARAGNKLPAWN